MSTQFLRAPGAAGRVWYASGTAVLQVTADGSTSPDTVWSWASTGSGDFVRSFAVSEDEQILVVGKDELSGPNYVLPPVHVDLSTGDTMTVGTEWLRPVAVSPGGTRLLAFAQATEQESAMGYEWVVVEFGTGSVTRSGVGIAGPAGTEAEAVDFRWRWEGEDPVIAYLEDETLRERNLRSGSSTTLGTLPHAP